MKSIMKEIDDTISEKILNSINMGIDVHKVWCVVTIKRGNGKTLDRIRFRNNEAEATSFAQDVAEKYEGLKIRAVCESTANYWMMLYDILEEHGVETYLAHPAKVKVIAHAKIKDDRVDSDVLADLLRANLITASYVPDKHHRDLRTLSRITIGMRREAARSKNKIHAILAKYDYEHATKTAFTKKDIEQMMDASLSETDSLVVRMHLETILFVNEQVNKLDSAMAAFADKDERAQLLMTIPGISYATAIGIISEIAYITRFATAEKLVSYAGLVPSRRDSADSHHHGGITKEGSVWLRRAMCDTAIVAIRHDGRMKSIYERVKKRRGWQKAKVAVARHLTEISWHILTKKEPYRTQMHDLTERKYKAMHRKATAT